MKAQLLQVAVRVAPQVWVESTLTRLAMLDLLVLLILVPTSHAVQVTVRGEPLVGVVWEVLLILLHLQVVQ